MSGWAWRIDCQNAAGVCPESVRPDRSVIVPEIIRGSCVPCAPMARRLATIAAFALSVSKIVSIRIASTPPRSSASICSW